jgi:predicted nucleic acid-binding protein
VVFDASTLILLAKLELLPSIVSQHDVLMTPVVEREAVRRASHDAVLIARLMSQGSIQVVRTPYPRQEVRSLQKDFGLAAGEATSLWLAASKRETLATDDGPAIRACKVVGVPFVTAIHFLLDALRRGDLSQEVALAKLERLAVHGRYHQRILDAARSKMEGE